jgi:hypothetical protein
MRTKSIVLVIFLALAGTARGEDVALLQGTSGSKSGDFEVRAGGLVVREGAPGSAFGTVRKGGKKQELSYFVVFKHRLALAGKTDCSEETNADDREATTTQTIALDDKKLVIAYKITYDSKTKKVLSETLSVNGKAVDIARGRVFVADLTAGPVKWEQKKLKLPADVPDTADKKDAEALANKVLASLGKQDKAVAALLKKR